MNEIIKGQLDSYCEFVRCGKPAAMLALQDRYVKEAENIITNKYSLMFYEEDLAKGWKTIWIYKENYLLDIILALPEQPKTIFEHWVLGKVFGYSEQAIKDFLETNQFL